MPTITFHPADRRADAPAGTELLAAAREAGVDIDAACGGKGTCGQCRVRVLAGELAPGDPGCLSPEETADGWVLACMARLAEKDVTVHVPDRPGRAGGKFADEEPTVHVAPHLLPTADDLSPVTVRHCLTVPPPRAGDGLGDLERLLRAMQGSLGDDRPIRCDPHALATLADAVRADGGRVTVTTWPDGPVERIAAVEPGDTTAGHLVAAVDVGTTTVAVELLDAATGRTLAIRSGYNDQISCGLDVIGRINYARRPDRLDELRRRGVESVNGLLSKAAADAGRAAADIDAVTLSGNTTMTHLLLGLPPEHIRLDPYTPTVLDVPAVTASQAGLAARPTAPVAFSPCVGSYVGGDITAGLLCTEIAAGCDELCLFVDIGTNGELAVGNAEFLLGCACSAGPAFEGGGIGCGMRAAAGAIEKVAVEPETATPAVETIGDVAPAGICGSGMIDLLANLFAAGWLDPAGKLNRERPSEAIRVDGRRARYVLASAAEAADGEPIAIDEADIENILRAKAAIYAGASLMLAQLGLGFDDVTHVYIAGGFGRFLNLDQALVLGLVPDLPRERFRFLGNASLAGSHMAAMSAEHRRRQRDLADRMTYLDLSTDPTYMDQYTAALFLPHTDPTRFPTVARRLKDARP